MTHRSEALRRVYIVPASNSLTNLLSKPTNGRKFSWPKKCILISSTSESLSLWPGRFGLESPPHSAYEGCQNHGDNPENPKALCDSEGGWRLGCVKAEKLATEY